MITMNRNVEAAAKRLREAAQKGIACAPVRNLIGTTDLDKAYAVQEINTTYRIAQGGRIVGSKIGLTSTVCLLYTSPSPRDRTRSRMPSSA